MEKKYALLIDADNVSAKYIKPILDELSKYGKITTKRIYGDWTSTQQVTWKDELLQNSIIPIQQFAYTNGKNATDSALIIDAMDILYTNALDGFCIVSSDSDFTRLASRIRENGLTVVGMGENKTPQPFRKACDVFTTLELLIADNDNENRDDKTDEEESTIIPKAQLEEKVVEIIAQNLNDDKATGLGELGNRLVKLYPDFDVRSYGYKLLSKFLDDFEKFSVIREGNDLFVELNRDLSVEEEVETYIRQLVGEQKENGIVLGSLGQKLHAKYPTFSVRDLGYSQFDRYIRNLKGLEVVEDVVKEVSFYE